MQQVASLLMFIDIACKNFKVLCQQFVISLRGLPNGKKLNAALNLPVKKMKWSEWSSDHNLNKIYCDDKSWQQSDSVCIKDGATPGVDHKFWMYCVFFLWVQKHWLTLGSVTQTEDGSSPAVCRKIQQLTLLVHTVPPSGWKATCSDNPATENWNCTGKFSFEKLKRKNQDVLTSIVTDVDMSVLIISPNCSLNHSKFID